ncbi:MAG: hypothetical protein KDD25_02625 [Bdellovibrionales bacterium]|nr:hypothetical protein [Bdellovibrionales bacterium]
MKKSMIVALLFVSASSFAADKNALLVECENKMIEASNLFAVEITDVSKRIEYSKKVMQLAGLESSLCELYSDYFDEAQ